MPVPFSPEVHLAHVGRRNSFMQAEKAAREVLRQRGYSEEQIDRELRRARRKDQDSWPAAD